MYVQINFNVNKIKPFQEVYQGFERVNFITPYSIISAAILEGNHFQLFKYELVTKNGI
jgi:hypothetical protein